MSAITLAIGIIRQQIPLSRLSLAAEEKLLGDVETPLHYKDGSKPTHVLFYVAFLPKAFLRKAFLRMNVYSRVS
jgi:hypothetical protein